MKKTKCGFCGHEFWRAKPASLTRNKCPKCEHCLRCGKAHRGDKCT